MLKCHKFYRDISLFSNYLELFIHAVWNKTTKCWFKNHPLVFKPSPSIQPLQKVPGCDWIHDGDMFLQAENASSQPRDWSWTFLTSIQTVEDRGWPHYPWMPDGHISSLQVRRAVTMSKRRQYEYQSYVQVNNIWYTFFPNHESFRYVTRIVL